MKNDFEDQPKSKRYEPSVKEINDLERSLKPFTQKAINGKLVSPFDQYLLSLGVIRFGAQMETWCRDSEGYERLAKTNARLEMRLYYAQEKLFQQFPEERKVRMAKYFSLRKGMTLQAVCPDCRCLLKRTYVCRHTCTTCLSANPVTV